MRAPPPVASPDSLEEPLSDPTENEDGVSTAQRLEQHFYKWTKKLEPWQSDLLRRLARGNLSEADQEEVLAMLVEAPGAPSPEPLTLADLPLDEAREGVVELRELGGLRNINQLAKDQVLRFEPGLNVIFGPTGTGKSGYGRLLRHLSRGAVRSEVLRDVFAVESEIVPQRASLTVTVDGEEREIAVDLTEEPERILSAINVFDAECAHASFAGATIADLVPRPLLLFHKLAKAQSALAALLREQTSEALAQLPPLPQVSPNTPMARVVADISADTEPSEVKRLLTLDEAEQEEMRKLNATVAAIQSQKSSEEAKLAKSRNAAVIARELEAACEGLSDERLRTIADLGKSLGEAAEAERLLAEEAFSEQLFPGTGQKHWQLMWKAVQRFVKDEDAAFPGARLEACPLCQQDLSDGAWTRLEKFEDFVRGDIRERITALSEELESEVGRLPNVEMVRARVETAAATAPENVADVVEASLVALSSREESARLLAKGKQDLSEVDASPAIDPLLDFAEVAAAATKAPPSDGEERDRALRRLAELQSRAELTAALPSILERIACLRKAASLEDAKAKLSTKKISTDLRRFQETFISDQLDTAFWMELEGFELATRRVRVQGKVSKGESIVRFGFNGMKVATETILSDGEKMAVALAYFLAESAVGEGRSTIVLDDPTIFLDDEKRRYAARRLVEESQRRQVVVLTHDLALLHALEDEAEDLGEGMQVQNLRREADCAGIVEDPA